MLWNSWKNLPNNASANFIVESEVAGKLSSCWPSVLRFVSECSPLLSLNFSKTKAIVFGTPFYIYLFKALSLRSIPLYGSSNLLVSYVRSLGLTLDYKLYWNKHILRIVKSVNTLFYRLHCFKRSMTFAIRKHLIKSLHFLIINNCFPCLLRSFQWT